MSDNTTTVVSWLKARKGQYFCHVCVSEGTGVQPVNEVNQIIRPLGHTREFRYMKTTCSGCTRDRNCVAYFG